MRWNWEQSNWPDFTWQPDQLRELEEQLLVGSGMLSGAFKHLDEEDAGHIRVEIISNEAIKTSEIEGEYLDRESVQSSIRRQFGLQADARQASPAEQGIADMMLDLYRRFQEPITHKQLYVWHSMLMSGRDDLTDIGRYRRSNVQVVSGPDYNRKVHFEAPPPERVMPEMRGFITWFNSTSPNGKTALPALTRAGIAHLRFVCIHPFEDGNGRIGRAVSEKALAQCLGKPSLIALSANIEKYRKAYYDALRKTNRDNGITEFLVYFARTILQSQEDSLSQIEFLINKAKMLERLREKLNNRQEKALLRIFKEGPAGFTGGLSAENYISITKATRPTATRDLADLVSKGALTKKGDRKYTRYYLNLPENEVQDLFVEMDDIRESTQLGADISVSYLQKEGRR